MMAQLNEEQENYLKSMYYDTAKPAAYSGIDKFYRAILKSGRTDISLGLLRKWLNSHEVYTVHKPVRKTFKHRKVVVESIDEQWDSDLMVLDTKAKENDGYRYLMLCIDTLSKFVWVEPLKTKTGVETKKAFQRIFAKGRHCLWLRTDRGSEYCNGVIEKYFKEKRIRHFVTHNSVKANFAERAIRTIKQKLFKYFTYKQSYRYIDILQDFIGSYNGTYHRSILMRPNDLTTHNQQEVWENIYGGDIFKINELKTKFHFKVGDLVRLSHTRGVFSRGYDQGWSDEIFIIKARHKASSPTYSLKDYLDEDISGTVYSKEIIKVTTRDDATYKIEKVLKKRRRGRKTEYFVKWLGWGEKFNTWVSSTEVVDL